MTLTQKPAALAIGISPPASRRGDLAIPVRADSLGRLAIVQGDDLSFQTIATALRDGSNENAWRQDDALGESMVFDPSDESTRIKITIKIRQIFDDFEREKRFRLIPESLVWTSAPGTLEVSLKFIDLETAQIKDFKEQFGG